jgi:hypothetical protein
MERLLFECCGCPEQEPPQNEQQDDSGTKKKIDGRGTKPPQTASNTQVDSDQNNHSDQKMPVDEHFNKVGYNISLYKLILG